MNRLHNIMDITFTEMVFPANLYNILSVYESKSYFCIGIPCNKSVSNGSIYLFKRGI